MTRITAIVDDRRACGAGPCAVCGADATMWLRSTSRAGVPVAARSCDSHEHDTMSDLRALDVDDIVRLLPRRRRAALIRRAREADDRARAASRASADLAGASSLTHTAALVSASHARAADGWRMIADACSAIQGPP